MCKITKEAYDAQIDSNSENKISRSILTFKWNLYLFNTNNGI